MKDNLWRYDPTKHERKKLCRGEGFMKFDHWWLSHVGPCTDNNCPHEVEEIEDGKQCSFIRYTPVENNR
jgi:hypothetical protein